jgi:hypothetical protein
MTISNEIGHAFGLTSAGSFERRLSSVFAYSAYIRKYQAQTKGAAERTGKPLTMSADTPQTYSTGNDMNSTGKSDMNSARKTLKTQRPPR